MRLLIIILLFLFLSSCTNDDDFNSDNLLFYINDKNIEAGAVIACAASEENSNEILTFLYPENGATNIRLYKTDAVIENELDYSKYTLNSITSAPFFNGYLRKFTTESANEHWVIITFELNNEIKLSNPIRIRHIEKPTVWNDAVTINQNTALMPEFSWETNAFGENAIYFQVLAKANNDLISGTYTYENMFQFYNTANVVLNITQGLPQLESNSNYNFTLMDVSLDNWVNLVTQKAFNTP